MLNWGILSLRGYLKHEEIYCAWNEHSKSYDVLLFCFLKARELYNETLETMLDSSKSALSQGRVEFKRMNVMNDCTNGKFKKEGAQQKKQNWNHLELQKQAKSCELLHPSNAFKAGKFHFPKNFHWENSTFDDEEISWKILKIWFLWRHSQIPWISGKLHVTEFVEWPENARVEPPHRAQSAPKTSLAKKDIYLKY